MLEKEQYEPWLNANSGYWSQPLAAYADAAVWSGDPKVALFKDTMNSNYLHRLQGPDLDGDRRGQRRLRDWCRCARRSRPAHATPEAAAAEAERRAKRYFRRAGPVSVGDDAIVVPGWRDEHQPRNLEMSGIDCFASHSRNDENDTTGRPIGCP